MVTKINLKFEEDIYKKYYPLVNSTCRRLLAKPDILEDAIQSVFLLYIKKEDNISSPLSSWFYWASVNVCKVVNKEYMKHEGKNSSLVEDAEAHHKDLPKEELFFDLGLVLDQLPTKKRDMILMRYYDNKSYREIGSFYKSSEDSVQKMIDRTIQFIKSELKRKESLNSIAFAQLFCLNTSSVSTTSTHPFILHNSPLQQSIIKGVQKMYIMAKIKVATIVLACFAIPTATYLITSNNQSADYNPSLFADEPKSPLKEEKSDSKKPNEAKVILPSWVPTTIGTAVLAPMTNKLDSNWSAGVWAGEDNGSQKLGDYSGGVYNPYSGKYGEILVHGGGHAANHDNSVSSASLDTLSWTMPGAPTALKTPIVTPNQYDINITKGPSPDAWPDTLGNPREVAPGVPGSCHSYDSMQLLPPNLGGGEKGSLIRLVSAAVGASASRDTGWTHRFDRATNTWSRFSTNFCAWSSPGVAAVLDTKRGIMIPLNPPGFTIGSISYLDVRTRTWTNTPAEVPSVSGYIDNNLGEYHSGKDIIVQATCADKQGVESANFYWFAGSSNISKRALVTWTNGTGPRHFNWGRGSLAVIPESGQIFYWTKWDADQYYLIDVPANPANAWTWKTFPISGVKPSALTPGPASSVYDRMAYSSALKSIVWATGNDSQEYGFGGRVWVLRIN